MHGLMHKLGTEGKEVYLKVLLVTLGMHPIPFPWPNSMQNLPNMTWHDDEELVVHDHFHLRSVILAPSERGERQRRVHRMAPNLLSPFIAQPQIGQSTMKMNQKQAIAVEMVMRSNAKHLMPKALISHFEPHLFPLDVSYQNVNEAKVFLWLVGYKKEVVDIVFKAFNFVTPNVPAQPNEIFIMKFMDYWSMGGLSKSIDVGTLKKYRLKIMGRLLFSTHNAYQHQFMAEWGGLLNWI
ncbi:hypothetical protein CK203_096099 [Vitis vinifera]|uniref:Uncharacterized protein n=1 Tax=Vitis vinifera TaxID=29760 RepID=A0A438CN58_VITVI|nr:hypothetical protein CK203_096099 [Vitis vinifera]